MRGRRARLDCSDPRLVGAKAARLAELERLGVTVPRTFIIPPSALVTFMEQPALARSLQTAQETWSMAPVGIGKALADLRRLIQTSPLPSSVVARVRRGLKRRSLRFPIIVRSSAVGEDDPEASAAGIYHSSGPCRTLDDVLAAIQAVWASLYTERAFYYRDGRLDPDMGVILQNYVEAEVAGVLLTQANDDGLMVTCEWNRGSNRSITEGLGCNASVAGSLATLADTPVGGIPGLGEQLIAVVDQAQSLYGLELEVEWAYAKETLYCLQVRPIVTVGRLPSEAVLIPSTSPSLKGLRMGQCQRYLVRQYQKKLWVRRFAEDHEVDTFRIGYLFFPVDASTALLESVCAGFVRTDWVQIGWGTGSTMVSRKRLVETVQEMADRNLLDAGWSCLELGEVVVADVTGFASLVNGDTVWVEAFPNGVEGIKQGRQEATTYRVTTDDRISTVQRPAYIWRGVFAPATSAADSWRQEPCAPFSLDLDPGILRQLAYMTRVCSRLGEVRLEWYQVGPRVYLKDLSVETHPLDQPLMETDRLWISPGIIAGEAIRIDELRELEQVAEPVLSVVNYQDEDRRLVETTPMATVIAKVQHLSRPVVIAPYPSMGLSPLIPHVRGFIFERGNLLCHLAIILRERQVPALVSPYLASRTKAGEEVRLWV